MSALARRCDDRRTLVLTARFAPAGLALTCLALAFAIATGAVALPDLPGALADATRSLDAWIYPAIAGLIFLECSLLLGWLVHGELVLLAGGVAAERGDASVLAIIALAATAAVAGDAVSFLFGRRLGRPFLELPRRPRRPRRRPARARRRLLRPPRRQGRLPRPLHRLLPRHDAVRRGQLRPGAALAAALQRRQRAHLDHHVRRHRLRVLRDDGHRGRHGDARRVRRRPRSRSPRSSPARAGPARGRSRSAASPTTVMVRGWG